MPEITNLEWILPDELDIARKIVKRITNFSSADRLVSWHELSGVIPHRGAEAALDDFETVKLPTAASCGASNED